jgi:hypothetical protein
MVREVHRSRLWAVARGCPRCDMTIATPRRGLAPARPDRALCFTDADGRLCMNARAVLRISIPHLPGIMDDAAKVTREILGHSTEP